MSSFSFAEELKPFKTDYCTNYPEGTPSHPDLWKHCCLFHDMTFWAGGTHRDRNEADLTLRNCIDATGAHFQAKLMYYAVRISSHSPYKYPDKKWNNGWPSRPDFQALSPEDVNRIEAELKSGYDFVAPSVKENFIHLLRTRQE